MKKVKYIMLFVIMMMFVIFTNKIYASNLKLNNLEFEATLNEDGSMNVTEIWDIRVSDTNTLYKTFKLNNQEFDGFSNASVYEILDDGSKIPFTQTYEEAYHVEKGSYYSLINSKSLYEIAWGVSIDSTQTKKYEINYTVNDIINRYTDCEELYWQFLGNDFEIYANKVEGKIHLPNNNLSKDDIKVWAHGPLNGNIFATSNNEVEFEVENLASNTMLEVRIVTKPQTFVASSNYQNKEKLNEIIKEETKWADEANKKRDKLKKAQEITNIVIGIFIGICSVFSFSKIIKYIKILMKTPKKKPEIKLDYYREIPGGKETVPADAAFMKENMEGNIPNIISATILDLALRKAVSFEIIDGTKKEKEIKINLLLEDSENLNEQEQRVYDYLKKVAKKGDSLVIKDLEKYIQKHISSFNNMAEQIIIKTKETQVQKGNYDVEEEKKSNNYKGYAVLYFVLVFILLIACVAAVNSYAFGKFVVIPIILTFIAGILSSKVSTRYSGFTQKGLNEKEQWKGLKKYMKEFSLLNEKEIPALVLWEQYLVYATVFGIAEKVLKQLKVKYPDLLADDMINQSTYMYLVYNNSLGKSLTSSITNSISNSYYSGNYSSGSGRRRRLFKWRPEAAAEAEAAVAVKAKIYFSKIFREVYFFGFNALYHK